MAEVENEVPDSTSESESRRNEGSDIGSESDVEIAVRQGDGRRTDGDKGDSIPLARWPRPISLAE